MINGTYSCCMSQNMHGSPIRRYGELKLHTEKGILTGTMFPTMFWLDAPFSCGSTDGKHFSFTVHFSTPCQQFSMDVEGDVDGDVLTGTVHSPMGEYRLDGTRQ